MRAARAIVAFAIAAPAAIGVTVLVVAAGGSAAGSSRADLASSRTVALGTGARETARLATARAEVRVAQSDDTPVVLPSPQGLVGGSGRAAVVARTGSTASAAAARPTARAPPAAG